MSDPDALPTVRLVLGDSVDTVLARSTDAFAKTPLAPDQPAVITEPVRFEYARPDGGFTVARVGFLALTIRAGHVEGARVSPQTRLLAEDEALALARDLGATLDRAGWQRDPGIRGSLDDRFARVCDAQARAGSLGRWWHGGDRLDLSLRRSPDAVARSAEFRPEQPVRAFTLRASLYSRGAVDDPE